MARRRKPDDWRRFVARTSPTSHAGAPTSGRASTTPWNRRAPRRDPHRSLRRSASSAGSGGGAVDAAKLIADLSFSKLPESRGELQDIATTHRHSVATLRVAPARRDGLPGAPRPVSSGLAGLGAYDCGARAANNRSRPSPTPFGEVRRFTPRCSRRYFPREPPTGSARRTRKWSPTAWRLPTKTSASSIGVWGSLCAASRAARRCPGAGRLPLEIAGSMQASVAALSAEIINVREQARLEAMAFEISKHRRGAPAMFGAQKTRAPLRFQWQRWARSASPRSGDGRIRATRGRPIRG